MYHSKYFPRIFYTKPDGGKDSGVRAYFLIEWKILFSIGLLHFKEGSRDNYHSHAFNACTWWVKGDVLEETRTSTEEGSHHSFLSFTPSVKPKITKRNKVHRVLAHKNTWAITFRGPWHDTWYEITPENEKITMTHGRKIV